MNHFLKNIREVYSAAFAAFAAGSEHELRSLWFRRFASPASSLHPHQKPLEDLKKTNKQKSTAKVNPFKFTLFELFLMVSVSNVSTDQEPQYL